jgi:hypothetical protein
MIGTINKPKSTKPMKTYSYYYNGQPITKSQFLQSVPDNWESEVIDGEYSSGYYRAVERN